MAASVHHHNACRLMVEEEEEEEEEVELLHDAGGSGSLPLPIRKVLSIVNRTAAESSTLGR